ncbi:hypothetical protein BBJ28_00012578 [Nothophytophthora sp. Chile5]|nr:hypothetical protein BBJ28_00012578 [Nothophytophthora sp. Chile5]
MLAVMSVGATRSDDDAKAQKKTRLRKRLRACFQHFHATAHDEGKARTEGNGEAQASDSAVKVETRASAPAASTSRVDSPEMVHSWSETEELSPVSTKPGKTTRRRRRATSLRSSPRSSPSSMSSSSSSSSSTSSMSRKGVTYAHDGELVSCRFCEILNASDEPFLYEDEDVVVFRPLAPVVMSHILVVPRRHIRNVNKLTPDDADLLKRMRNVAASVLREMPRPSKAGGNHVSTEAITDDDAELDYKFAFHTPPFNSIDHVHMHAFRTQDGRFGCVGAIKYRTETWWCRSFEEVMTRLGLRHGRRNSHGSAVASVEATSSHSQQKRRHKSHPPCGSDMNSNGSMALTSVESLG